MYFVALIDVSSSFIAGWNRQQISFMTALHLHHLLIEFSNNLLHTIRLQALHKDPLRRLEIWLYSQNNTTELLKQLQLFLNEGWESRRVKFRFWYYYPLLFKNFGALTVIILKSFTALCQVYIQEVFQPKARSSP